MKETGSFQFMYRLNEPGKPPEKQSRRWLTPTQASQYNAENAEAGRRERWVIERDEKRRPEVR